MLLPNEWIENSIETYIYQHTTKSRKLPILGYPLLDGLQSAPV